MTGRTLKLYTDRLRFHIITIDKPSKTLVIVWRAETEVGNIALLRVFTFRFRCPLCRVIECFIDTREWENGGNNEKGGEK